MPDDKSSKTEAPSKHKLQKSREQGQVARSADLSSSVGFTLAVIILSMLLPRISIEIAQYFSQLMIDLPAGEVSPDGFMALTIQVGTRLFLWVGPVVLIVWLATALTTVAQVGLHFSAQALVPKLDKVNPVNGFQRLFSLKSAVTTLFALAKMAFIFFIAGTVIWNNRFVVVSMNHQPLEIMFAKGAALIWEVSIKAALTLLLLALFDFFYQKWQFHEDQKMSKEELKQEYKQQEGDPHIKGRIRSRQRAAAQKRGLKESVDSADVVITNPYHIAVALKYDRAKPEAAPIVVAKGARLLAERIKQFAGEFDVEIIQNIPLARALYKDCRVDAEISPELYVAVAEVLAIVYAKKKVK